MSGLSDYLKRMQDSVVSRVDELEDALWELALFLHKNPEIGGEERISCQKIVEILSEHGFDVKTGVAGLQTAFVAKAVGRAERPCVAFLAEYDALPEIGHACGHNLIAAASVGAGLAAASVINELDGSVAVVGTPGEENIGGKAIMAEAGVFEQFDAALMFHPSDRNSLDQRLLALDPVKFTFAVGGKDGVPYPVSKRTYDQAISFMQQVLEEAEIGREEKNAALKRLLSLDRRMYG